MTTALSKTILNRVDAFPALPATVSKVITITDDAESSAEDLMEAILPDQAMCLTILKIANSAFFGLPRQVSTIDKAVMVLGFNEIRNIVLGKAVFNSFRDVYRNNRETINAFWEHSFLTGLAAKIIAEDIKYSPSESFIAGLIHDIGRMVMLISLNSEYTPIFEAASSDHPDTSAREHDLFSISHADVGYRLLKRWLFPPALLDSTKFHHAPHTTAHSLLSAIIQVADLLAHLHVTTGTIDISEIESVIDTNIPDVKSAWGDYNLEWNNDLLPQWQQELLISSDRDRSILTVITT